MDLEMICLEGFDDAIVGTGLRDADAEVIVYDANKMQEILLWQGFPENSLVGFLETIDLKVLGNQAPLFIYLDAELEHEVVERTEGKPRLRVVH
tara:strand:- start:1222 stop:1503 length:282 start_codon:yes stop_codon:yes gene_type:complete